MNQNKDTVIQKIISHDSYLRYCKKLCNGSDIHNDLYQEFFLFMFEKTEEYLVKIYESGYLENYCLSVIFNKSRERGRFNSGNDSNPLLSICNHSSQVNEFSVDPGYDSDIDKNFDKVMCYLEKTKSIKQEDVAILFESVDNRLINISKKYGIPYITLKTKRKKIRDKIKRHVKI